MEKPGRPKGQPKTGGRTAGTPNKKTISFSEELEASGFNLSKAIVNLYNNTDNENIKLHLIELVAKYKVAIPKYKEIEEEPVQDEQSSSADILTIIK